MKKKTLELWGDANDPKKLEEKKFYEKVGYKVVITPKPAVNRIRVND